MAKVADKKKTAAVQAAVKKEQAKKAVSAGAVGRTALCTSGKTAVPQASSRGGS